MIGDSFGNISLEMVREREKKKKLQQINRD